ncbi:radical SAM/SPASM domain-containing protein [Bacteroides sp. 519]|uniref:radical SAM/SPASM domain-containing protein n=1 Tax=Bacteroides sp. 519 TaxID=2302937 RepID=UPI0013D7BA76|nr:radical SAM protein [Bacteroides sp. 519]NDV57277.1 radical SAM protein [Bacteroides sp. 519]
MPTHRSLFVTIKATLNCNLACKYCYGRDNHFLGKEMDNVQIKQSLNFVCEYAKLIGVNRLSLCWHGGEPLLLGEKRLEEVLKYASELFSTNNIKYEFGTQTNATLLTPAYYSIIKKYFNGYVGVSLDLFSDYRIFKSNKVSNDLVIKNIDAALAAGIRCGSINLITKQNINHIEDIYNFYKIRNMNVRLARVFPISIEENKSSSMYVSDEEFASAMIEYFNLWKSDSKPAKNTDIVRLVGDLLLGRPSICLRERNCQERYLALSPDGDIYPCAEFDDPKSVIGNFLSQTPKEFFDSDIKRSIFEHAPIPPQCSECKYETTCYGGCLRERFVLQYPFRCKSNVIYWDHILKWLESKGCYLYMLRGKSREEIIKVMTELFANS